VNGYSFRLFVTYPVTPWPRLSVSTRRRSLVRAQHRPYVDLQAFLV
jgi:hypothetical protein